MFIHCRFYSNCGKLNIILPVTSPFQLFILCGNWTWSVHPLPPTLTKVIQSLIISLGFNCFRMGLIISHGQDEWCVTVPPTRLEGVSAQPTPMSHWPQCCRCLDSVPARQPGWMAEATGGWKKFLKYIRNRFRSKEKGSWKRPYWSFSFLILQM